MLRLFHLCCYLVLRLFLAAIQLVPIHVAFLLGLGAGQVSYWLLRGRRKIALTNLAYAFHGQKTDAELRALNAAHFRRLGANLLSCLKIGTMTREEILRRVTVEKPASLNVPPEGRRTGWVAMISHLGNWELFGQATAFLPEYRFGAVYQRISNPFIEKHFQEMRAEAGVKLFERKEGFLRSIEFLREGGVAAVLVDQSAGYAGLWTPFFGRLSSTSTLAGTLALRADVPIVPIAIYTCGLARWRVVASEPIEVHGQEIEAVTAQINRQMEAQIIQSPEDWLWSHNRWKPLRPHFLIARDQRRHFFPPDFGRSALHPFRILVESPATLQQAQACVPAMRAIKAGRPDAFLAILAPRDLVDFWKQTPDIDRVLPQDAPLAPGSATGDLPNRFDAAIAFSAARDTARKFFRARIPIRVGPRQATGPFLYNQSVPPLPTDSTEATLHYLRAAQSVGANINAELARLERERLSPERHES